MSIKITTRNQCCDQNRFDPDVPNFMTIDNASLKIFNASPNGVAFTGAVHIPTRRIYLHPLARVQERGNKDLGSMHNLKFDSMAGDLGGDIKPILHPNMSPQLRAQMNLTSGHHQICTKYGLRLEQCVGFAITKNSHEHIMTTSSQTLNSSRFKFISQIHLNQLNHPSEVVRNFAERLIENKLGTGHMSKEWADCIAINLNNFFSVSNRTVKGNFESPI